MLRTSHGGPIAVCCACETGPDDIDRRNKAGSYLTREKKLRRLWISMSKLAAVYAKNHRTQMQMLAGGIAAAIVLAFGQSNERALFALEPVSAPTAFAAITEPVAAKSRFLRQQPPAGFIARPRSSGVLPGMGMRPQVPPLLLALTEPERLAPMTDFSLDALGEPVNPVSQPRGFEGGPLAGSSPVTFGPGAPLDPVPGVPEPATWLMMIVGFFVIGTTLRIGRRFKSVQF